MIGDGSVCSCVLGADYVYVVFVGQPEVAALPGTLLRLIGGQVALYVEKTLL